MDSIRRLWWVAPTVLAGSPIAMWHLEQAVLAEGNGSLGGLLGLVIGGLAGQAAEQIVGRM